MFTFKGPIESSKSWMNRALIIQYYNSNLTINGFSSAQDVIHLKKAIRDLQSGKTEFNLAEGGTTFRFFSLLCSRLKGDWKLNANQRLLQRPQSDLIDILNQLDVEINAETNHWIVNSKGWRAEQPIHCSAGTSSQFISGMLLNSWNLTSDLHLIIPRPIVSEDYLNMTLKILKNSGLKIEIKNSDQALEFLIAKHQISSVSQLAAELDVSSAFSLSAAAVIGGNMQITNWDSYSTQPDMAFLNLFKRMNISYTAENNNLIISRQTDWKSVEVNLLNEPDLFPVLAVVCALAHGTSFLYGASQLKSKESDRLAKTRQLLTLCGFKSWYDGDGLRIEGQSAKSENQKPIAFDPDQDHRMAMAAGLLKLAGFKIEILNPEVVQKSYPGFWQDIQVQP